MMKLARSLCFDFFLDLFFPTRCPACGVVVGWDMVFCNECEDKLEYIEALPWQAFFPADIDGKEPSFDYANALFRYEGTARKALLAFKYDRGVRFAGYAAKRLPEKLYSDEIEPGDIDLITAVPMHRSKRAARGYDQAELFAKALSAEMGIEYRRGLIAHRKRSISQHELSKNERYSSAQSTYYIASDERLDGKTVMLCDDVLTTGATADACASLLKEMGAAKVYIAAVCRTMNDGGRTDRDNNDSDG